MPAGILVCCSIGRWLQNCFVPEKTDELELNEIACFQTKLYDNNEHKKSIIVGISLHWRCLWQHRLRKRISSGILRSGSNYVAYRGPQKQLTAAPKGYKPSIWAIMAGMVPCYMIGKKAYDVPYFSAQSEAGGQTDS